MTLPERFQEWLDMLYVSGKSDSTVSGYRWEIEHWAAAGGAGGDTTADLARFLAIRRRAGAAEPTLKRTLAAMRSYFEFVRPADNPAKAIPWPAVRRRFQRSLDSTQAMAVISSCDTATLTGSRDLALICLLLDTGLRAAEVCRLKLSEVDLRRRELTVVIKGGDESIRVFSPATAGILERWLELRPRSAPVIAGTLFISVGGNTRGQPLTTGGLRSLFQRLGKRAGLKAFSPHDMRRSYATLATRNRAPQQVLRAGGGWEDDRQLKVYTAALTAHDMDPYLPVRHLLGDGK